MSNSPEFFDPENVEDPLEAQHRRNLTNIRQHTREVLSSSFRPWPGVRKWISKNNFYFRIVDPFTLPDDLVLVCRGDLLFITRIRVERGSFHYKRGSLQQQLLLYIHPCLLTDTRLERMSQFEDKPGDRYLLLSSIGGGDWLKLAYEDLYDRYPDLYYPLNVLRCLNKEFSNSVIISKAKSAASRTGRRMVDAARNPIRTLRSINRAAAGAVGSVIDAVRHPIRTFRTFRRGLLPRLRKTASSALSKRKSGSD